MRYNSNVRKKSKKVSKKLSAPKKTSKPSPEPLTPFLNWFKEKLDAGEVLFWQDNELLFFFRENGLRDQETKETYDKMLKFY